MAVNFEVKGMLARLLATEDVIVEHRKVDTACFDVQTRVLTLPMWERASNDVYDLLLSHEAAHALYTPNIDWTLTHKIPPAFVNVVEDARIEKLVRRRYPGLIKTFFNGYKELLNDGFFELDDEDISTFNLADRANLYFKIGSHLQLNFNDEEQEVVDLIMKCETFDDTLNAAEILFNYCKDSYNPPPPLEIQIQIQMSGESSSSNGIPLQVSVPPMQGSDDSSSQSGNSVQDIGDIDGTPRAGGDGSGSQNQDQQNSSDDSSVSSGSQKQETDDNETNSGQNENVESESSSAEDAPGSDGGSDSLTVRTQESLDKSLNDLIFNGGSDNIYLEIPDIDISQVIIPNAEIHDICREEWQYHPTEWFEPADIAYKQFKNDAQKEVNFLIKEFESRKSADAYTRSSISKTGVLDCTKLHTYKFNDDIFKRITTVPDGKNHGLIFILDWSGSMDIIMEDTIKQLYNLIWFCRKVSIPFEVYAFTTQYPSIKTVNGKQICRKQLYTPKEGFVHIDKSFSLMQMFTSKVNVSTLEIQMKNIFRLVYTLRSSFRVNYRIPRGLDLSGTPLNESLVCLNKIIPQFRQEYKLQKVQCIVLTDGDGSPLKYHRVMKHLYSNKEYLGESYADENTILRNKKTGNTYKFSGNWFEQTPIFLRNLRDTHPDTNFIGIRILGYDATNFVRRFSPKQDELKKLMESWKKYKTCNVKDISGYHSYFGISGSTLSNNSNFSVSDSSSKSKIKSAFIKSLRTKKMNKKILTEFIDLVV